LHTSGTAVIGAGRMGSVIARQLPPSTKKIIIDTDLEKACGLADAVDGIGSDSLKRAVEADLIAVVLPAPAVNETVIQLIGQAKPGTIILNMATAAVTDPTLQHKRPDISLIDAKIIGHAQSISGGEPGIVVVNTRDEATLNTIRSRLPEFYAVVSGDPDVVAHINRIASTEGIRAAVRVRHQLAEYNIPNEWIDVAIRTVCAGTLKAFVEDDLGDFARELVKEMQKRMVSERC